MFINELKNGSQRAYRTLVEEYSPAVLNTCYSFVKNKQDAEDIAQDVFLEVYRSAHSFRADSDLNTWIYRIAINKSLDFLRKQKRKKRLMDMKGLFFQKSAHNTSCTPPHRQLEQSERQKLLHQHIQTLPENQQIALALSLDTALSNNKIAQIMKTSETAVESLLHRARSNLRKKLQKYYEKNQNSPQGQ